MNDKNFEILTNPHASNIKNHIRFDYGLMQSFKRYESNLLYNIKKDFSSDKKNKKPLKVGL